MTDFFESFSDEIEENAGGYAALGGLAALKGQQAQKESLNNIKEQLAKIENKQEREAEIKRSIVKFEEYLDSFEDCVNSKEQRFQLASSLDFESNHFSNTLKFRDANSIRCSPSELLSDIESIKYARLLEKKTQSYDLILKDYNNFYLIVITALKNTCFDYNFLFKAFRSTYKSEGILEYFTYENDADFTLPDGIFDSFKKELEFIDERNKLVISDDDYYAFLQILCEKVYGNKDYKILGIGDLESFSNSQFIRPYIRAKRIELVDTVTKGVIYSLREAKVSGNLQNLISFSRNKEYEKNKISPWEKDEFLIDVRIADNMKGAAFDCSVFKEEFDKITGTYNVSELRSAISSNNALQRFNGLSVLENFIVNAKIYIDKSHYIFKKNKRIKKRRIIVSTLVSALVIPVAAILTVHTTSFKTIPYFSDKLDGFVTSKAKNAYDSYKVTEQNIKLIESSYDKIFSHFSDDNQTKKQQLQSLLAQEKAEFKSKYGLLNEIYSNIEAINNIREENYNFTKLYYDKHVELMRDINTYINENRIPINLVKIPDQIPDFQNLEIKFGNYTNYKKLRFVPFLLVTVEADDYDIRQDVKRIEGKYDRWFFHDTVYRWSDECGLVHYEFERDTQRGLSFPAHNLFLNENGKKLRVKFPEHISDRKIFYKLDNSLRDRVINLYIETLWGVRDRLHTIETVSKLLDEEHDLRKVYNNINGNTYSLTNQRGIEMETAKAIIARCEAQLEELEKINITKLADDELARSISEEKNKFETKYSLRFDDTIPANNLQEFRMNLTSASIPSSN